MEYKRGEKKSKFWENLKIDKTNNSFSEISIYKKDPKIKLWVLYKTPLWIQKI